MSFKSRMLPADAAERQRIHAAFNDWVSQASDDEFLMLERAREILAPHQVCSIVSLVRGCLARQDLALALPDFLLQQLKARNLQPACADAQVP